MAILFNFLPTSNHLRPLEVDNCDSNSRLVVDEMTMANSGLKGLKYIHDLYSVACILFDNVLLVFHCIRHLTECDISETLTKL